MFFKNLNIDNYIKNHNTLICKIHRDVHTCMCMHRYREYLVSFFFYLRVRIDPIFSHKDSFFFLMGTYYYKTFHIYAKHIKTNMKILMNPPLTLRNRTLFSLIFRGFLKIFLYRKCWFFLL